LRVQAFSDVMQCYWMSGYHCFKEFIHLTTQYHIPEDLNPQGKFIFMTKS